MNTIELVKNVKGFRAVFGNLIAALLLLCFSQAAAAKISINYNGALPRNSLETGTFDLTVQLNDVLPGSYTSSAPDEMFGRLLIELEQITENGGEIHPTTTEDFRVQLQSSPSFEVNDDQNYNVTIPLTFTEGSKSLRDIIGTSKILKVQITYDDKLEESGQEVEGAVTDLALQVHIPNEAPFISSITGIHEGLKAFFSNKASGSYTGDNGAANSGTFSGVVTMAISTDLAAGGDLGLNAFLHRPAEDTDLADENVCVFKAPPQGNDGRNYNCIVCSGDEGQNFYLDHEAIDKIGDDKEIKFKLSSNTASKTSLIGLELGKQYAVFSYFRPNGAVRSACVLGTPIKTLSLAEILGESDATETDATCFVATAAYGDPDDRHVRYLRWWRDAILKNSDTGLKFVNWYYENGPALAAFIEDSPTLRFGTRALLWPVTAGVMLTYHTGSALWLFALTLLLIAGAYIGFRRKGAMS